MRGRSVGFPTDDGARESPVEDDRVEPGIRDEDSDPVGRVERGPHSERVLAEFEQSTTERRPVELPDDEDAAGTEHPGGFGDHGTLAREVVERVDDQDAVSAFVCDRQVRRRAADPVEFLRHAGQHPGGGVEDDPFSGVAGSRGASGSTAHVDDAHDVTVGEGQGSGQRLAVGRRHRRSYSAPIRSKNHRSPSGTGLETGPDRKGLPPPDVPSSPDRWAFHPRPAIADMEFAVRGDVDGGPRLDLDHERFAYAGKFVMTGTGKAVATEAGSVVAAVAFDRDRTDEDTARIRYVTVRVDRRGEGIGPRLLDVTATSLLETHERVRIAVNNPFAFEACYKAGFGDTGERTGLAELVLQRPGDRSAATYHDGLATFRERDDLSDAERTFLDEREDGDPPAHLGT